MLHGRQRTGKILHEVREGTSTRLTGAVRQKILIPLEDVLRTLRRPGGPAPRGGDRPEMGWFGGRGSGPPSPKAQKAAEESVEHPADVNTARTRELEVRDRFAKKAITDAQKRGASVSEEALKQAHEEVAKELRSRQSGLHN
jgi:hypothetical protein